MFDPMGVIEVSLPCIASLAYSLNSGGMTPSESSTKAVCELAKLQHGMQKTVISGVQIRSHTMMSAKMFGLCIACDLDRMNVNGPYKRICSRMESSSRRQPSCDVLLGCVLGVRTQSLTLSQPHDISYPRGAMSRT